MNTDTYIANAKKEVNGIQKEWIDDFLFRLPKNATIFEIGSATARDALYMENSKPHSVNVICSDIEDGFIEKLEKDGRKTKKFNILKDTFDKNTKYDAIYSHNVIHHFTPEELRAIFEKMYNAIKNDGYISFSFAQGNNSTLIEWNNKKGNVFCRFYSIDEIKEITDKFNLEIVYQKISSDQKTYFTTLQR